MRMRALGVVLFAVCLMACGDDGGGGDPGVSVLDAGTTRNGRNNECVDEDNDGFGWGCPTATDCDDEDPDIGDECRRCVMPNEGCPCDPGTRPMFCKPDVIHAAGGYYVCEEGSRYCRDEIWSSCEAVGDYTFVPTGN